MNFGTSRTPIAFFISSKVEGGGAPLGPRWERRSGSNGNPEPTTDVTLRSSMIRYTPSSCCVSSSLQLFLYLYALVAAPVVAISPATIRGAITVPVRRVDFCEDIVVIDLIRAHAGTPGCRPFTRRVMIKLSTAGIGTVGSVGDLRLGEGWQRRQ